MSSPADLVTLATAKIYLGNSASGNDQKLAMLITSVSMAILAAINRTSVLPKTYTEVRSGNRNGEIMLRNWPVQSVQSVSVLGGYGSGFGGAPSPLLPSVNGGPAGYVIETADDPPAGSPQTIYAPCGGLWAGKDNVTIIYTAGYQVTGEAAKVPAGGGTVTVAAPYGAWGADVGVTYASGPLFVPVKAGSEALGAYSVSAGIYTFSAADAGASVLISYGYIPADLANACLEWIADRLAYQDRIGMASKSLGGQETVSFKIGAVPDFVTMMLANYKNVVPIT